MKPLILIVSYLWKDTCARWFEQPGSLLARCSVTALLVAVSTVILVSLHMLERSLRERLERFGLNTLLVREMVTSYDPELLPTGERVDRLAPLAGSGTTLRLRQLLPRAQSEWQTDLGILSYSSRAPGPLVELLANESPLICLSTSWPEQAQVRVSVNQQVGVAVVRRPSEALRPLVNEHLLLVPQGWLPEEERKGYVDTYVFLRDPEALPMAQIVEAVQTLYAKERRTPQIQSALSLIQAWEVLKERQRQWRGWLAIVLGFALALVFGSIAVLEFRQNLFVTALLRSFGVPALWLWARQWIENGLLANLAAIIAIGSVWGLHATLFGALGFPRTVIWPTGANPYFGVEVAMVLIWVNIGALLSSLPVAAGLRLPVGKTLN
ncbi:MAG: hypothetical protein FJ406_07210 [Verrucomicrobia bacterium]|nr:hypothetical protein [Verrucomicrobiota bacterium]